MRALLLVTLLMAAPQALLAACTAGKSQFVLTSASAPTCLTNEIGVLWSKLNVALATDCTYTISGSGASAVDGTGSAYKYPTSVAAVSYKPNAGQASTNLQEFGYAQALPAYSSYLDVNMKQVNQGSDFKGFTTTLSNGLPPLSKGPLGPDTNTPAGYTYKQLPTGFTVTQPPTGCTFTYRITSGTFGGMKPQPCSPGSPGCPKSCAPGQYRQAVANTFVCALCSAGNYSSGGTATSCTPCKGSTVAAQAGASACTACTGSEQPVQGNTACAPCSFSQNPYSSGLGAAGNSYGGASNNSIYYNGATCSAQQCPAGTVNGGNNACIGANAGRLCQALPMVKGAPYACTGSRTDSPLGGAVLKLQSSDMSAPACVHGAANLAAYLKNKLTWMGFNFTGSVFNALNSPPNEAFGLNWAVLGQHITSQSSPMLGLPICGNAHGGPGSIPALAQVGQPLGTQAALFGTVLNDTKPTQANLKWDSLGWGAVVVPGSAPGTIQASWFPDSAYGSCGTTSLSPKPAAGTCVMTFQVVSGSVFGVSASGSPACPSGTAAIKQPSGGAPSCAACGPGTSLQGSKCVPCTGKTYQDTWGATSCKKCSNPFPGPFTYQGAPPEANTFCYS